MAGFLQKQCGSWMHVSLTAFSALHCVAAQSGHLPPHRGWMYPFQVSSPQICVFFVSCTSLARLSSHRSGTLKTSQKLECVRFILLVYKNKNHKVNFKIDFMVFMYFYNTFNLFCNICNFPLLNIKVISLLSFFVYCK